MPLLRLLGLTLLTAVLTVAAGHAQRKQALVINRSANDSFLAYYTNVLLERKQTLVHVGDTLRIAFDENSFDQINVNFALASVDQKDNPVLVVLPGDIVFVRYDKAANTYAFEGRYPAELRFYDKIWRNSINLCGHYEEMQPLEMPATIEAFMGDWQRQREASNRLVEELCDAPGIRPVVAAALARELQVQAVRLLLRGNMYHARYQSIPEITSLSTFRLPGAVATFPAVYRDSVAAQLRVLRGLQTLPIAASQQRAFALQNLVQYAALAQDRAPSYGTQYALAKQQYSGPEREWACYAILRRAQLRRKPVPQLVKDYRRWMMPESKWVQSLTGQHQLSEVLPAQLMADTDTLVTPDNQRLTLAALLARHRGQVIYLDFWASWCGPCLMEMPASEAFRQRYRGQNVAVLYLSLDDDPQQWQRARARFAPNVPGHYRFATPKSAKFLKRFAVNAIPRYILLDKYGIMRYAEALGPDDPTLPERIAAFLVR